MVLLLWPQWVSILHCKAWRLPVTWPAGVCSYWYCSCKTIYYLFKSFGTLVSKKENMCNVDNCSSLDTKSAQLSTKHSSAVSTLQTLWCSWVLVLGTITPEEHGRWLMTDASLHSSGNYCGARHSLPPLDNIQVMMIVWRLRANIIRAALCWIVWHNVHSQQHTYMSSSYRSNRLGLSHWDPYAICRGGCLELYYCNMVEWFGWDSSLILTTDWFNPPQDDQQCVYWDVKQPTYQPVLPGVMKLIMKLTIVSVFKVYLNKNGA